MARRSDGPTRGPARSRTSPSARPASAARAQRDAAQRGQPSRRWTARARRPPPPQARATGRGSALPPRPARCQTPPRARPAPALPERRGRRAARRRQGAAGGRGTSRGVPGLRRRHEGSACGRPRAPRPDGETLPVRVGRGGSSECAGARPSVPGRSRRRLWRVTAQNDQFCAATCRTPALERCAGPVLRLVRSVSVPCSVR